MNHIAKALRRVACLAAAGAYLPGLMGIAHADVKITLDVTTENGSSPQNDPANPPVPRKVTVYYKGKMARREVAGGATTLYDGAANKVYALYPDQKTYSVAAMKDAAKLLAPLSNVANTPGQSSLGSSGPSAGMRQETQTTLDKTGLTQSVAGKDTQKYTLDAWLRLVRDQPSGSSGGQGGYGGGGGGRRGRRGGQGGGGQGNGGGNSPGGASRGSMVLPTTEMEGEYWLADAAWLPEGGKNLALPLLVDTVPPSDILKSLNARMTKLKLIPLLSRVTLRTSAYNPNGSARALTALTTQVTSITEMPLDDALFLPPADYQKVDPEAAARQSRVSRDVDGH